VFPRSWIDDMAFGFSVRPAGLGRPVGLGFFPIYLIFGILVPTFTTHPKLMKLY
jgi:hypothetical protein